MRAVSTNQPAYLPTSYLPTNLPTYLPTSYLPTNLPTYLPATYQPTNQLNYLPTYLLTSNQSHLLIGSANLPYLTNPQHSAQPKLRKPTNLPYLHKLKPAQREEKRREEKRGYLYLNVANIPQPLPPLEDGFYVS